MKKTILLVFFLLNGSIFAGNDFLLINQNVRDMGCGNATTAILHLSETAFNPAGIQYNQKHKLSTSYLKMFGELNYGSFSFAFPVKHGTISIGYNFVSMTPVNEILDGAYTGHTLKYNESFYKIGYAFPIQKKHFVGIDIKYYGKMITDKTASSLVMDIGYIYSINLFNFSTFGKNSSNFSVGISLNNLGNGTKLGTEVETLPLTTRIGLAYSPYHFISFSSDIERVLEEKYFNFYNGIEISPVKYMVFRIGEEYADKEFILTSGLGFNLMLNSLVLALDYSLQPFNAALMNHRISLSLLF